MDSESFLSLLEKFISDLGKVFETKESQTGNELILKMLSKQTQYIDLCRQNLSVDEIVRRHFDKLVEYEKCIIAADASVFDSGNEVYMLKYVNFSVLWNASEMTQKNKEMTMKYLQTLLTIGKINQSGGVESIQDLLDQMQKFKPVENVDTTKGTNVLNRLMEDVSKDMEGLDLGIDESKIDPNNVDLSGIMQQLMGGGKGQDIMSVVTKLASRLQQQVETGEVSQDELAVAAQNMMAGMGGNGGMNMGAIMQMMGGMGGSVGGMGGSVGGSVGESRSGRRRVDQRSEMSGLGQAPGVEITKEGSSGHSGKRGKGGKRK